MQSFPPGTTDHLLQSASTPVQSARLALVLLASGATHQPDRQFLLTGTLYQVTCVETLPALFLLQPTERFALALLSDTLGPIALAEAARLIRSRWPSARILILGHASVLLEDHLYDEAIPHPCNRQLLVDTLARMSGQQKHGRPFIVVPLASAHNPEQRQPRRMLAAQSPASPKRPERMTQLR